MKGIKAQVVSELKVGSQHAIRYGRDFVSQQSMHFFISIKPNIVFICHIVRGLFMKLRKRLFQGEGKGV